MWSGEFLLMSELKNQSPMIWLLKVASLFREDWQWAWMREALPLLVEAQWGTRLLDIRDGEPAPEELDGLLDSVTEFVDPIGLLRPERVLVFVLADWERFSVTLVEPIFSRLSDRFPEAKIEGLLLHQEGSMDLEIVLAAGTP